MSCFHRMIFLAFNFLRLFFRCFYLVVVVVIVIVVRFKFLAVFYLLKCQIFSRFIKPIRSFNSWFQFSITNYWSTPWLWGLHFCLQFSPTNRREYFVAVIWSLWSSNQCKNYSRLSNT